MSVWQQLVTVLGGGTVILGAVAWLIRSIVRHLLDRNLAAHQTKLDAQHELELERTRSGLQKDFLEHEVRFRTLHAKVAETIAETYSRLVTLHGAVGCYVAIYENRAGATKAEKLEAVAEANRAFNEYFFPKEIYLQPELGTKIRELCEKLFAATDRMTLAVREERVPGTPNPELWLEAFRHFQENARPLFDELKREFHAWLAGHAPSEQVS